MTTKSKAIEPVQTIASGNGHAPVAPTPEQRAQACWLDIQRVLSMHRCNLDAIPVFTAEGRVIAQARIVPVPDNP